VHGAGRDTRAGAIATPRYHDAGDEGDKDQHASDDASDDARTDERRLTRVCLGRSTRGNLVASRSGSGGGGGESATWRLQAVTGNS